MNTALTPFSHTPASPHGCIPQLHHLRRENARTSFCPSACPWFLTCCPGQWREFQPHTGCLKGLEPAGKLCVRSLHPACETWSGGKGPEKAGRALLLQVRRPPGCAQEGDGRARMHSVHKAAQLNDRLCGNSTCLQRCKTGSNRLFAPLQSRAQTPSPHQQVRPLILLY